MTARHQAKVIFMTVTDQRTKASHDTKMSQNCSLSQKHKSEMNAPGIDDKAFLQVVTPHIQK